MLKDLGVSVRIRIKTDTSVAKSISNRKGLGRQRHIEVNQLWLQDKVYKGEITLNKVKTDENIADALAKAVGAAVLGYHVDKSNAECRRDRHRIAPMITEERSGEEGGGDDDGSEQERWLESVVAADGNIEK